MNKDREETRERSVARDRQFVKYSDIMDEEQFAPALKQYKLMLRTKVIALFVISILVILERIFYQPILNAQLHLISHLQLSWGLVNYQHLPGTIYTFFPKLLSFLGLYRIQFLILTHIFATLFMAVDAIFASKLIYTTLTSYFGMAVLQLIYAGSRPFWSSSEILSSYCVPTYAHPSLQTFSYFFVAISLVRWKRLAHTLMRWLVLVVPVGIIFTKYVVGEVLLVSIGLSLIFVCLYIFALKFADPTIETLLKKSTVMPLHAKKYSFYWLLCLILAETVALIMYSCSEVFVDIGWIQNMVRCLDLQKMSANLPYDEVVGPWYTFLQTTVVFGLIGGIFGIARTFRMMSQIDWYGGTMKTRVGRGIVTNVMIIPSWILVVLGEGENGTKQWIRRIGVNNFLIDGLHWFVLYVVLLGYCPSLLQKLNLISPRQEQEQFLIRGGPSQEQDQSNQKL